VQKDARLEAEKREAGTVKVSKWKEGKTVSTK
jgi:hypothetical protein